MKTHKEILVITYTSPETLDTILNTCNYEASGDGSVLVDTDQLDNTSDTSGRVNEIRKSVPEDFQGLVLLRS